MSLGFLPEAAVLLLMPRAGRPPGLVIFGLDCELIELRFEFEFEGFICKSCWLLFCGVFTVVVF